MEIFVECLKAKDKDTLYHVLKVDMGYRCANLTMEKDVICELADIKFSDLYAMKQNDRIEVGILKKV